ncbi:MAG TPA: A24 family peptidase [Ramlibacter sp.]|nr:A24 family peptidase [Ramlibacter sp.]
MKDATSLLDLPALLAASPRIGLLIALVVVAGVIDYRSFRIPNWLTVGGVLVGLVSGALDALRPLDGFLGALAGMAVGFAVMLPFYALRVMGAGDVKLMAAVGAFLGFPGIVYAVLFTFITGGVAALAFAVFHRVTGRMAHNVSAIAWSVALAAITGTSPAASIKQAGSIGKLPYAISIGIGTVAYLVAKQLGYA